MARLFWGVLVSLVGRGLCWSCNDAGAETKMELVSLKGVDAKAVCNDGSAAGYYFSKGSAASSTFLVYLSGGGQCYDEDSCVG